MARLVCICYVNTIEVDVFALAQTEKIDMQQLEGKLYNNFKALHLVVYL